jgi:transposase-like protein
MGRPPSDIDDHLEWQQRLKNHEESGLSIEEFCRQQDVSRSTFYRWLDRLKDGIPESMAAEKAAQQPADSGSTAFVPITLKASPVEIELPNGGVVRLPLSVGQAVLVEVIRAVGALPPWKGRTS